MHQGLVRRIQCFQSNHEHSAHATLLLYAHRRRPSLIVQEIDLINPSKQTLDLELGSVKPTSRNDVQQLDQKPIQFDSHKDGFLMTTKQISTRQSTSIIVVTITGNFSSETHVNPDRYVSTTFHRRQPPSPFSQMKRTILTVTKFSPYIPNDALKNVTYSQEWQTRLQQQAKEELSDALSVSSKQLLDEHIDAWSSLWQSGFSISRSLAPSAINGDVLNRTMYYVLCSIPSPLFDRKINETNAKELNQTLFQIDQCYQSHSTL